MLFLRVLLRPARVSPLVDRIMVVLIATAAATAPAMILPAPLRVAAHALAAGISPLVVLVAMLHLWRQGVRHAGTAAIGWGPGLLVAVYLYLRVHDVTPYHPWNHLLCPVAVTFGCACFAWVLAQSIRSVEERTLIDPLTGLWNRRWLAAEGEAAIVRCRRSGGLLSVAVFDADYFKQINDRWGHGVGDVVLKHLAARATETLRPADRVARIGGEELCILLPDLTAEQAAAAVERVRATIEASGIGPLPAGAVTISGGVALNRGGTVPFDALLHAADTALYRAKEAGRNRVAIAPQVTPAEDAQSRRPSDGALQPLFAGPDWARAGGSPGDTAPGRSRSALADLHPRVLLVDNVESATPTHEAVVLVACLGRAERVADAHLGIPSIRRSEVGPRHRRVNRRISAGLRASAAAGAGPNGAGRSAACSVPPPRPRAARRGGPGDRASAPPRSWPRRPPSARCGGT